MTGLLGRYIINHVLIVCSVHPVYTPAQDYMGFHSTSLILYVYTVGGIYCVYRMCFTVDQKLRWLPQAKGYCALCDCSK